jgi:hypothetical protein
VVLIGTSSLTDGVRSENRGDVTVTEPFMGGGVTERPIDPLNTMKLSELNGFGHLHFHP